MAQSKFVCAALVAVLSILGVQAQQPQACQSVTGMQGLNATQLAGTWFETARAPAAGVACIKVNAQLVNNNTQLAINTTSSASTSSSYMNQHSSGSVNVTTVNTNAGFNITYNNTNAVATTYKILNTDYTSFLVVCGYTSDNITTSFGTILTRTQNPNSTWVAQLVNSTSSTLSNFNTSTVVNVPQNNCYASSASTSIPILSSVFAAFYLLVKFMN